MRVLKSLTIVASASLAIYVAIQRRGGNYVAPAIAWADGPSAAAKPSDSAKHETTTSTRTKNDMGKFNIQIDSFGK